MASACRFSQVGIETRRLEVIARLARSTATSGGRSAMNHPSVRNSSVTRPWVWTWASISHNAQSVSVYGRDLMEANVNVTRHLVDDAEDSMR
jgi:hypothetical protein